MGLDNTSYLRTIRFPSADFTIVQADSGTALALADIGELGDHVATAADTTRKLSNHELDSSDVQAAGGTQFKLLGKIDEPDNAWGEHVNVKVMFNQHHLY